jgi:hypothetical protein
MIAALQAIFSARALNGRWAKSIGNTFTNSPDQAGERFNWPISQ